MCRVDVIAKSVPEAGLSVRAKTDGPEAELLCKYLDYECDKYRRSNTKSNVAVFVEPHIDSGYPDAVIIRYSAAVYEHWPSARDNLAIRDLKVLSCLRARGASGSADIGLALGFGSREIEKSLASLAEAGVVRRSANRWRTCGGDGYFGIRRIKVVEAKMSAAREAVRQASGNRRFSNESYVLLGSQRAAQATAESCRRHGVGLIAGARFGIVIKPRRGRLPSTVPLLQFNEWVGRCLAAGVIG